MRKIRAAVVGYGNIGHYAVEALEAAKDFEIVGIVRRQGDKDKPLELTPYEVVDDIKKLEGCGCGHSRRTDAQLSGVRREDRSTRYQHR